MAKFIILFTSDSGYEVHPLEAQDWDAAFAEAEGVSTIMEGQRGKTILDAETLCNMVADCEAALRP
jgi:hypothetical protein